ncbi:MAG: cellobiose phosphorylase [Chloroflexi bacterium]|nr:cellobiose phosphorylase [Chloroflexota bacterium]
MAIRLIGSRRPFRRFWLLEYLHEQESFFRKATQQVKESGNESLSNAGEWMSDNFYLVQQTCLQVREDMPQGFYRLLPALNSGALAGFPRLYAIGQELVVASKARLDIESLQHFCQLYQDNAPLTTGELWALPVMLRLGLIEFLAQTLSRITGLARKGTLPILTLPHATTDDEIVANCIISLRTLANQDWQTFFESVSRVEKVLRDDPAAIYARMDRETRDRYRKVIEGLALATGKDEQQVAQAAIELSQANSGTSPRAGHVGYYLVDAGRDQLRAQLGYAMPWRARATRWILHHPTLVYLGSIGMLVLITLLGGVGYARNTGAPFLQLFASALLLLIPALTMSVSLVNWILSLVLPPRVLPKMDFEDAIPAECKTIVVVPALLTSAAEVKSLLQQLELHFLRSQDPHLYFALLTDLPDAPELQTSKRHLLVEQCEAGIRDLNAKYPRETTSPFYLFHRDPKWNPSEEQWMGWERKRGKLHELNLLLRGRGGTAFSVQTGDPGVLREIKYVITLDADTIMPRQAAHRLVGTLAHPLNHAEFDPHGGSVIAGYTLLQPGIEITSTSANISRFARIFSGDVGLDLYSRAVSNAYQDLFGEGIYIGKGIYDLDAFERSLAGRIPENALLSHDLIEGVHGRVGLVSDVVLFEDYPPHYFVHLRRLRRWIRGDWQLLPWLLPRVPSAGREMIPNDLSIIARWKIFDNLRRSLVSPALLVLFVAGWLWLPGSSLAWTLMGLLTPAVPVLTGLVVGLAQGAKGRSWWNALHPLQDGVLRWLLELVFIPYETLVTFAGIATTLVRLLVTGRHLLQWTSYADTVRLFAGAITWGQVIQAISLTGALGLLIAFFKPAALWVALPLLIAWLLSPEIAYWISSPVREAVAPLGADERQQLRNLARRTWSFSEQFVGPTDHWLPPDHFQEAPGGIVAHSTSPTNLGLFLLSTLGAYDLGYTGLTELAARLRATFDSMEKLEKYRGHFMNWYDTRTLEPLLPLYVSTVDSGNLVACLQTLRQGCQTLPGKSILRWQSWEGLLDAFSLLQETLTEHEAAEASLKSSPVQRQLQELRAQVMAAKNQPKTWVPLLDKSVSPRWNGIKALVTSLPQLNAGTVDAQMLGNISDAVDRVHNHLRGMQREIEELAPWLPMMNQPPILFTHQDTPPALRDSWLVLQEALPLTLRLGEVERVCETGLARLESLSLLLSRPRARTYEQDEEEGKSARAWCALLAEKLRSAAANANSLLACFRDLERESACYFQSTDFGFLFDAHRLLFHIGYNVSAGKLDDNYYDLLASESRIASLVAIADNQVPSSHWLHLGRPLTQVVGTRALVSWGGTMFEYLMPSLIMREYEGSLLQHSCLAAVEYQMEYGKRKKVPWGISESGYYAFDANQNYQYRAFGVPGLGFKRNLAEDLVIAPYASLLALSLRPRAVIENIARLEKLGMSGKHGLYEAIDFSTSRVALGESHSIVRSYMAHHQGMILLSLVNFLHDNVMVHRFHSDPLVRSAELLLQEKVPYDASLESTRPEDARTRPRHTVQHQTTTSPWSVPVLAATPQVHFLSNGDYGVLVTSVGAGYSRWRDIDLTRWRADTTLEDMGTWLYVQDMENGNLWSATFQPTSAWPESQEAESTVSVHFYAHMAEFQRNDHGISLTMEVVVAPDDPIEIRYLTLTNHGDSARRIALTSYGEVILAPQAADARHPAFNKMFIESEYSPETNALLFHRRLRSTAEEPIYLAHAVVVQSGLELTRAFETDRACFLGRGKTLRAPAGLVAGTVGATLDPIMSLRQEVELYPHATVRVAFVTLAAPSREKALGLAERYQNWSAIEGAFDQARVRSELELRQLDLTTADLEQAQQLLSILLYPQAGLRSDATTLAANRRGQPGLWPFSISGDYPILLVKINLPEDLAVAEQVLQAHRYWRNRHIKIDLVILNQQATSYSQVLRGQLQRVLVRQKSEDWVGRRGGIFILYADQMGEAERVLLETAARVVLDGKKGSLALQLERQQATRVALARRISPAAPVIEPTPELSRPDDLLFDNGLGGFSADGREYVVYLAPDQWTPAPWINVIANPDFGFTVSEAGGGNTWSENSSENRLTPWSNDPVGDPPGEALYLRDEETAEVWSPTPLPCRAAAPYLIRHGAGYSTFEHNSHGLVQRLRLFAAPDAPVKVMQLRLENTWPQARRITATLYLEWVLGVHRDTTQQYVVSEFDVDRQALLARNTFNTEFGDRVAFVAANKKLNGYTADRTEFLGRMGSVSHPAALDRIGLGSAVEPGVDPCAALQLAIDLEPGESEDIFFLMGEGASRAEALQLIERYRNSAQVKAAWDQVGKTWDDLLGSIQVQTPDPAMDLLLNRWLLYQTLSCRIWGRSAFYQSSGAFGFRDQLQDVLALIHTAPRLAREHILQAAQFQFEAGDVLHWWHLPSGRGVRTRSSDDLLWLPFVTAQYVTATGDTSILDEQVPFRRGAPLETGEDERYDQYPASDETYTLYEHCSRALEKGTTVGPRGLPLMGTGDWNDGMNRVGIGGRGESVWVGWFLCATWMKFAALSASRGDEKLASSYHDHARQLSSIIESSAWDGNWYRRAFYDDGTPLGSAANDDCQIDSVVQSWAVLSGASDPARAAQAMESVVNRLVCPDDQLLLLLVPPFDKTPRDPGYIKGYPPGVRENGGQYTHAALWSVWAFAELGQGDRAEALFRMLNPIYHANTPEKAAQYKVEPYVVAADVYSAPSHLGRGGWTWYTGSSGWMYRVGLEALLGMRRIGKTLQFNPCIPKNWASYEVTYRVGGTTFEIHVKNPAGVQAGVKQVTLDGQVQSANRIPLSDDGQVHQVVVLMEAS